jgi:hypothetical protein
MLNYPRTSQDVLRQESLPAQGRQRLSHQSDTGLHPELAAGCGSRPQPRLSLQIASHGAQPRKALLQDLAANGCAADGARFAVLELLDENHNQHLTLVTSESFGPINLLELLCGTEINLDPLSSGINVLPLALQSKSVLHHLLDQLLKRYKRAIESTEDSNGAGELIAAFLGEIISSN